MKEKRPKENQFGIEVPLTNGEIWNWDLENLDQETLQKMANDETISAALDYMTNYILAYMGEYVNENEDIQEFVLSALENMDKGVKTYLKEIIRNVLIYGWNASELVWKVTDGKIGLRKLVVFDTKNLSVFYGKDSPEYLIQQSYRGRIRIPFDKVFKYSIGPGLFGSSYLKKVYRLWKAKSDILKLWAVGLERYALPIVWGKTPNVTVTKDDGSQENAVKLLNDVLKDAHKKTSIATDQETELQYLDSGIGGTHFSNVFKTAIEYLNVLIFRNFGLPNLLLGSQQGSAGAYALGNVHFRMFNNSIKSIAADLGREFVDEVLYKLIYYNYGEVDNYGYFHIGDEPNPEQMEQFSKAFVNLVNAGLIDPISDSDWIRDYLKLPKAEEE